LQYGATTRGTFECLLVEEDVLRLTDNGLADEELAWYCKTPDHLMYQINRPDAWFKERLAVSGETVLTITNADKINGGIKFKPQMIINDDSQMEQSTKALYNKRNLRTSRRHRGRQLAPVRSGTNTVLVIRGISGDGAPTKSVTDLAVDVFGGAVGGVDPVNLVSQYAACSGGHGGNQYRQWSGGGDHSR
jgi:hypothetical protein